MTDTPTRKLSRKPKKSETLEVRLPHETKQAFLSACREDGTTASEVVRESIDGYLEARGRPENANPARNVITMIPKPIRNWRVAAGAAGAASLAVFAALPSAADPDFQSMFNRLDKNGDGVLTAEEFFGPRDSANGEKVVIINRSSNVERAPPVALADGETKTEERAFSFWLGAPGGGAQGDAVVERREMTVFRSSNEGGPVARLDPEALRQREFGRYDIDGDGKVTFAEYQTRQREMHVNGFHALDKDADGFLTKEEYRRIASPIAIRLDGDGAMQIEGADAAIDVLKNILQMQPDALSAQFDKLDKNRDGKLSLQEYLPAQ